VVQAKQRLSAPRYKVSVTYVVSVRKSGKTDTSSMKYRMIRGEVFQAIAPAAMSRYLTALITRCLSDSVTARLKCYRFPVTTCLSPIHTADADST